MNLRVRAWLAGALAMLGAATAASGVQASAPTAIYNFQGGSDGSQPVGSLVADPAGNLYGVTVAGGGFNAGTVFELAPPSSQGGSWTESVLYTFTNQSDGGVPYVGLTREGSGNLYGTTSGGGCLPTCGGDGYGTVFKMTPPASKTGAWTFTTIYRFQPKNGVQDGANPEAPVTLDSAGNLYGTTDFGGLYANGFGTVFKLAPPSSGTGPWAETLLHVFSGYSEGVRPHAGVIFDRAGNLYGTTIYGGTFGRCCGTVFELSPTPSGPWTDTVLFRFNGKDGRVPTELLIDGSGNLFGGLATGQGNGTLCPEGCGAAFEMSPPAGGSGEWSEQTIFRFPGGTPASNAGVSLDQNGTLYGAAGSYQPNTQGNVYSLSPSGKKFWNIMVTPLTGNEGASPQSLATDPAVSGTGTFYGVADTGGTSNHGTIFTWTP